MAKVVFSSLVSSVSGRVGPSVFQNGPGGAMVRATASAPRRFSAAQQEVRQDLAAASALWATLDNTTRALWASIGRAYDPATAGPGLAYALGRRTFIRWAVQYIHFGLEVPVSPVRWPFYDYGQWTMSWDPDSDDNFIMWQGPGGANTQLRIWLQAAPYWPHYSPRSPWLKAYDTKTDPRPVQIGTAWCVPWEPLLPFKRYGAETWWRARVTGLLQDGRLFSLDWGLAGLVFR